MARVRQQGFDEPQLEAVVTVIAMFNYFTRVADATGIDFDFRTPLPAFEPDRVQASAPRPASAAPGLADEKERQAPSHEGLLAAWGSWRAYLFDGDGPLSPPDRLLLARVAAEEAADWAAAGALGSPARDSGHVLAGFASKLSREPWRMRPADLDQLRSSGYPELAVLHAISLVAHQNADSRLAAGLRAVRDGDGPGRKA